MKVFKEMKDLKKITAVAWYVRENEDGDCLFAPTYSAVRLYDAEGNYLEVPVHSVFWSEEKHIYNEYIVGRILNSIFHMTLGILLGKWIGVNCSLSEAVNQARKELPMKKVEEAEYNFRKEYTF